MRNFTQRYFYSLLLACITLGALGAGQEQEKLGAPDLGLVEKNILSYLKKSDLRPGHYLQEHLFEEMPPLEPFATIPDVKEAIWSDDGLTVLVNAKSDRSFKSYDLKKAVLLASIPRLKHFRNWTLSCDGSTILIKTEEELISYDAGTGAEQSRKTGLRGWSDLYYVSADGSIILIETKTKFITYDVKKGKKHARISKPKNCCRVNLSADGSTILIQTNEELISYDAETGIEFTKYYGRRHGFALFDKAPIWVETETEWISYDAKTGRQFACIPRPKDCAWSGLSYDGSTIFKQTETHLISYDAKTGLEFTCHEVPDRVVTDFRGRVLVIGTGLASIPYDLHTGELLVGRPHFKFDDALIYSGLHDDLRMIQKAKTGYSVYDLKNNIFIGRLLKSKQWPTVDQGTIHVCKRSLLSIYNGTSSELYVFLRQFVDFSDGCFNPKMMKARKLVQGLNYILWRRKVAKEDMHSDNPEWNERQKKHGVKWDKIVDESYKKDEGGVMRRKLPQLGVRPEYFEVYNDPIFFPERIRKCLEGCVVKAEE